jgi:hypothetical protein
MLERKREGGLRGLPVLVCVLLVGIGAGAQDKGKSAGDTLRTEVARTPVLPGQVLGVLVARFPGAEIQKWTKETEGGVVLYDVEFTREGQHCEADVTENGVIDNWEKAIAAKELPVAVLTAVEKRYPMAVVDEVMQTTRVKNGKDELEGYEITLRTAEKKAVEVTVAPDGRILEDSGARK